MFERNLKDGTSRGPHSSSKWQWPHFVCAILLLHVSAGHAAQSKWTISATYATQTEALTFRNTPLAQSGQTHAVVDQSGLEDSGCPNALIRHSHASANAEADSDSPTPSGVDTFAVKLSLSAKAQGGGYRTCDACLLTCIGLHPHDTEATASVRASSEIVVQFSPGSAATIVDLEVDKITTGNGTLDVFVQDREGHVVARITNDVTKISLDAQSGNRYLIRANLIASASDRGTCCDSIRSGSANLKLRLSSGGVTVLNAPSPVEDRVPRVLGGQLEHRFPAIGYILNGGKLRCTGSVVGSHTILTAAHCVDMIDPTQLTFVLADAEGTHPDQDSYTGTSAEFPKDPSKGPAYDKLIFADDIALLYVGRPIADPSDPNRLTPITPLPLHTGTPTIQVIHDTISLLFVGYGFPDSTPGTAGPVLTNEGAKRSVQLPMSDYGRKTFENRAVGQNTCGGDSGGPALLLSAGVSTIVGIVSNGDAPCQRFGINTRLDAYSAWIAGKLK